MHKKSNINRLRSKSKMIDYKQVADSMLYEMCLDNDGDAWDYVYKYATGVCQFWNVPEYINEEEARIMVEKLWEGGILKVKNKDHFRYFLKMAIQNRIKTYLRSPKSRKVSIYRSSEEDNTEEIDPRIGFIEPDQLKRLNEMQVKDIVNKCIEKLPKICQPVMREYLNLLDGLYKDYEELSRVLRLKVPTISSRVTRCMRTLVNYKEIQSLKSLFASD